jgi:hypothetical protein
MGYSVRKGDIGEVKVDPVGMKEDKMYALTF